MARGGAAATVMANADEAPSTPDQLSSTRPRALSVLMLPNVSTPKRDDKGLSAPCLVCPCGIYERVSASRVPVLSGEVRACQFACTPKITASCPDGALSSMSSSAVSPVCELVMLMVP